MASCSGNGTGRIHGIYLYSRDLIVASLVQDISTKRESDGYNIFFNNQRSSKPIVCNRSEMTLMDIFVFLWICEFYCISSESDFNRIEMTWRDTFVLNPLPLLILFLGISIWAFWPFLLLGSFLFSSSRRNMSARLPLQICMFIGAWIC